MKCPAKFSNEVDKIIMPIALDIATLKFLFNKNGKMHRRVNLQVHKGAGNPTLKALTNKYW